MRTIAAQLGAPDPDLAQPDADIVANWGPDNSLAQVLKQAPAALDGSQSFLDASPAKKSGKVGPVEAVLKALGPASVWSWGELIISVVLLNDSTGRQRVGLLVRDLTGRPVCSYVKRDMSSLRAAYKWLASHNAICIDRKLRGL